MGRYRISESVDRHGGVENVHTFEDLEKHHPSAGRERNREYATIDGNLEEVRRMPDGRIHIKKDFILSQDTPGPINVPTPVSGYVHRLGDRYNTVQIFDRPFGEPGAKRLGQVLHMATGSLPAEGSRVEYGEPLGRMGDAGTPNSIHAHVEVERGQFQTYIRDINNGTIQPGAISPMRDGVLRRGEEGPQIRQLQEALNRNGAQLPTNGVYGPQTEAAVSDYQRRNNLGSGDGIAGPRTLASLGITPQARTTAPPTVTPTPPPMQDGVLRRGEEGPQIRQLQEALNRNGAQLPTNGVYGPQTEAAVSDYQRRNNLESVDGIAGPRTLASLGITPQARTTAPPNAPAVTPTPAPTQTPGTAPAPVAAPTPFRDSPLSALIASGEGSYNSFNRGRAGDAKGAEIDFSTLTVGEVMRRQRLHETNPGHPEELFAVGKYQMVPITMRETVEKLGIDPNAQFTPQLQERMFGDYLIDEKREQVRAYVTGDGNARSLGAAQLALAQEFASVADPNTNRSYHDGTGGNSSSITAEQTATALQQMRERYQQNVQSGMSSNEAYREVSTGDRNSAYPSVLGGVLRENKGAPDDVRELQTALNRQGANLPVTGTFGSDTTEAVKTFQRAHNLDDDGIAGTKTLTALGIGQPGQTQAAPVTSQAPAPDVTPAPAPVAPAAPGGTTSVPGMCPPVELPPSRAANPQLSDTNHPENAMFRQAVAGLEKLGPQAGFGGDRDKLERAAATMVYEARVSGMTRIDHIVQSGDGNRLFAVQGNLQDPTHQRVVADKAQAIGQSVEQTTQALAQDVASVNATRHEQPTNQNRAMAH